MTRARCCFSIAVTLLALAARAAAQERTGWPERAYVGIDVPFQTLNDAFGESLTFPDTIRKAESGQFSAAYAAARGPMFDVATGVRLSRRVGVGAVVSVLQRRRDGSYDLIVPSPIAGNRPFDLSGSIAGLVHREIGVHVHAIYPVALGRHSRVLLSAGPSVVRARQDLVRSVEFNVLPGLTTVSAGQTLVTRATRMAFGFNVGAEITWLADRHIGIGALTRYTRANVTIDPGSASGVTRDVTFRAGGLQLGGGIRFRF